MKTKWKKMIQLYTQEVQPRRYYPKLSSIYNFHMHKNSIQTIKTNKCCVSVMTPIEMSGKKINSIRPMHDYVLAKKENEVEKNADGGVIDKKEKDNNRKQTKKITGMNLKNLRLFSVCFLTSFLLYITLKKVPEGYVCILEKKTDQTVSPYIYDDQMIFFYNPLKYKVVLMRIVPIHKKYSNIYETLDKKKIRVLLEVKMKPKIPFIIDIYKSFGSNYSRNYIEREMNLDIKSIVNQFNFKTFFQSNELEHEKEHTEEYGQNQKNENDEKECITTDDIVDQIMERFYDCSIFYKINILDVSILFEKVE